MEKLRILGIGPKIGVVAILVAVLLPANMRYFKWEKTQR